MGDVVNNQSTERKMMNARTTVTTDEYFGGCPHCGQTDGYLNVGKSHYFTCKTHRVYWGIGSGLFSSCQYESQAKWKKNAQMLEQFTEVEPIYPEVEAGVLAIKGAETRQKAAHSRRCECPECISYIKWRPEPLQFDFADEGPRDPYPTAACYEANFSYEKDGAHITRQVVFDDHRDLVLQINPRLSVEEVEQCLTAILADIKRNGPYTFEQAQAAQRHARQARPARVEEDCPF